MEISNLVLEITRKCQLKCAHCLRGNAQRMTMSHEVLYNTFKHLDSVATLTITGGEPSLAPEVLEELWNLCCWRKVQIGAFYIVTNGMPHNRFRRFLTAVERLYGWCNEQEACVLTVSRDQYHPFDDGNPWRNLTKFKVRDECGRSYGEFPPYFHPDARKHRINKVLGEGRALETHAGFEPQEQQTPWELNNDGTYIIDPVVYVSANGNVTSACNMSFDRIDREAQGNVLTKSLPEIIESYCTKEPVREVA